MTEPTNPLFEDEKEFLERKKLEYERALLGEVEEIKEHTVQVGKVALIGAGVVGSIWLLSKAFGRGKAKKKHKKHRKHFDDYAGFDGDAFDENDQELSELDPDFQASDYTYDTEGEFGRDGFAFADQPDADYDSELDDNGLSQYPDFPAHSSPQHGTDDFAAETQYSAEDRGADEDQAHSFASTESYLARPYDDSRRLPESDEFAEPTEDEPTAAPEAKRSKIGPALLAFAKSEAGRVVTAQAAAIALALITKAVQGFMPQNEEEAGKNADLAGSSAAPGVEPAAWPATSAAQDASAAARHDDSATYREPLA